MTRTGVHIPLPRQNIKSPTRLAWLTKDKLLVFKASNFHDRNKFFHMKLTEFYVSYISWINFEVLDELYYSKNWIEIKGFDRL